MKALTTLYVPVMRHRNPLLLKQKTRDNQEQFLSATGLANPANAQCAHRGLWEKGFRTVGHPLRYCQDRVPGVLEAVVLSNKLSDQGFVKRMEFATARTACSVNPSLHLENCDSGRVRASTKELTPKIKGREL